MQETEKDKLIAQHRLSALRSQMNPHFIFNAISAIQNFILQNERLAALEYLDEFASLIRKFLDHSRQDNITLEEEIALVISYFNLEMVRFGHKFGFVLHVDENIQPESIMVPSMIVQPYVENAIKHALMHKTDYGMLRLEFHLKSPNLLHVVVEDDGDGREAAQKRNEWKQKAHKSVAMSVTKERLEILNSVNNSPLSVDIEDLKDESGKACGTRVNIYIPIEQS